MSKPLGRAASEQLAFLLRRSLREVPPPGHRDGKTYSPPFDYERLNKQQRAVFDVMRSGRWLSLRQIADEAGCPEASASARIRDLRKEKFGGFDVRTERKSGGLFLYRLVMEQEDAA